jgi:hypothetical protein
MNIQKLMHVANRAKTIGNGDYTLPNVIFAILLEKYFGARNELTEVLNAKIEKGLTDVLDVNLETKESDGYSPEEVQYDLLTILAKPSTEEVTLASVCIPIPLLNFYSAIAAMKKARIVERGEHMRNYEEPKVWERSDLWEKVLTAIPSDIIVQCVEKHIADEAIVKKAKRTIRNVSEK